MAQDRDFRFVAEKVYSIPGRGVVVSGRVERGLVSVGDQIGFLGMEGRTIAAQVVAIEVSRRLVEVAQMGNEASLLLQGVKKEQITTGTIFTALPEEPSQAAYGVSAPETLPSGTTYSSPPGPYSPEPIRPASSFWRTAAYVVIGILILLLLMFFQGKWDPKKWDPRKLDPRRKLAGVELGVETRGKGSAVSKRSFFKEDDLVKSPSGRQPAGAGAQHLQK